ncbi:hypothetical protein A2U01_0088570, partial [Trifolium medium]|nr:hypothetical protein [Trifolium medium]
MVDAGEEEELKVNAATYTYPEAEPDEFSGGPLDMSALSLYAGH